MADHQPNEPEVASIHTGEIDEGLERDLRAVLGWEDENSQETDPDNQPESQEPQPNNAQPENASAPTPEPVVEIDGERIPISQVRDWRKGYLRQEDYTRKTQQLGEERRRLEEERRRLEPLAHVERLLAQNPQIAAAIQRVLREQFGVNVQPAPYAGPQVPQPVQTPGYPPRGFSMPATGAQGYPQQPVVHQPFQASTPAAGIDPYLDQRLARLEESLYDQQLDRMLENIRSQANAERQQLGLQPMSDDQWNEFSRQLMTEAYTTRRPLDQVWQSSPARVQWAREAVEAARQAASQQQQQRQAMNRRAGAVLTGTPRGGSIAPQQNMVPQDFSEATRRAYAELRQSGVSLVTSDE